MAANEPGWLWSQEVQAWVGLWAGEFQKVRATWLRFYTEAGQLDLTKGEAEAQRTDAAETEVARLRDLLAQHNIPDDDETLVE